jgi:hypothetical protein
VPRKGQALFGGEGLVLLSNQDLASYTTQKPPACRRGESSHELRKPKPLDESSLFMSYYQTTYLTTRPYFRTAAGSLTRQATNSSMTVQHLPLLADFPEQVDDAEQIHHDPQPQQWRLVGIEENRRPRQTKDRKHLC